MFNDFLNVLGSFFKVFGRILASKSRSKFDHDFGMLFCRITGRDAASTDRRRIVGGSPGATDPPRRRPFRAWRNPINAYPKHRKRDLTRSGPGVHASLAYSGFRSQVTGYTN